MADRTLSRRTVERYGNLLHDRGEPCAIVNDTLFYNYNRMVEAMAPVGHDAALTPRQARELRDELGGVLVRWGTGFSDRDTGWFCVICDDYPPLPELPSRSTRRDIRKGLRACRVEQIDAAYMAKHAYPVYTSAFARYSGRNVLEREGDFVNKMRRAEPYADLVHYWGVFHGPRLVGYGVNYVYEDIEVASTELKLDPAYLRHYSSAALIHTMTEHYLRAGVGWFNAGTRTLAHDTAFQDYLTTKFQYRRAFVRLRVAFGPLYDLGLRATRPLRGILGRADRRLDALYELRAVGS